MAYELRTDDGILVARFEGMAANSILEACAGLGHWRPYKSKDAAHSVEAYEIDTAFKFGQTNSMGTAAYYIWEGYILIPTGNE